MYVLYTPPLWHPSVTNPFLPFSSLSNFAITSTNHNLYAKSRTHKIICLRSSNFLSVVNSMRKSTLGATTVGGSFAGCNTLNLQLIFYLKIL
jgi:hypothetical protein